MKRTAMLTLILSLLLASAVAADHREERPATWLDKGVHHGFYFAPVLKFSKLDGESTLLMGGKVAWLIDHRFAIGFAGYGRVEDLDWNDWDDDCYGHDTDYFKVGYGGLFLEASLFADKALHLNTGLLIGAGARQQEEEIYYICEQGADCIWPGPYYRKHYDVFMVIEPEISLEANITRYFSFAAGLGYRFASGVDRHYSSNEKMGGLSANLTLKFGML